MLPLRLSRWWGLWASWPGCAALPWGEREGCYWEAGLQKLLLSAACGALWHFTGSNRSLDCSLDSPSPVSTVWR
ncbi:hypothetical protein I79_003760 [Cricetulus griseus]|uniref:Secreted protein n=1 Tax=Cricetulus griseus TaxID=10029 RepID=G3H0U1_CRIGR|nr:hypothetical protein I79_003760 [Cricetulus griseus]